MEIYNEQVKDLLATQDRGAPLKVREHKVLGTYVEGLHRLAVKNNQGILKLMTAGQSSTHCITGLRFFLFFFWRNIWI